MVSLRESASIDRSQSRDFWVLRTLLFIWVVPQVIAYVSGKIYQAVPFIVCMFFPCDGRHGCQSVVSSGWCPREGLFLFAVTRQGLTCASLGFMIPGLSPVLPPWTHVRSLSQGPCLPCLSDVGVLVWGPWLPWHWFFVCLPSMCANHIRPQYVKFHETWTFTWG